ncbi:hypothetical protein [Mycobacterium angelicum]|uniref:Uncharacterized protein n=1 Tax=Mycobacterium angelicum TaxID=470074 RepID=A0A1X0A8F7_MYCAN|nr:hypothetical protein [Mycobacterium angelicum]MCV7197421.1 hypothetical protein [Mycobacterium angelicum]ORA26329.1 hypothetical protein BST12_00070 [Mycobacterium angelicum]
MTFNFSAHVETTLGPLLAELGFTLDEVDDNPDEGGIERHIIYYRSADCKIQIFDFPREGEVNCMIAPLDASNEFGLTSKQWHCISKFPKRPNVTPQERLRIAIAEANAYEDPLQWVKDRVVKHYETARAGILEMYGN